MKVKRSIIAFILGVGSAAVMLSLSCVRQGMPNNDLSGIPVMGNQAYVLSGDEIRALQDQALKGSPESALRLHLFYEFVRLDFAESLHWVRIAAENGDPVGQYNLGFKLRNDPDPRNRIRARFWLERAAKNGDSLAAKLLKELPE